MQLDVQIPKKALFLITEKSRYKCIYGGRGSGKSHSIAKALLLQGMQQPHRVLCTREVQKSIRDSVKRLLDDQIALLGLSSFYESFESEIRGKNGTLFVFSGLSTQTVDSVKSFEGVTRCWIEEAQTITKRSLDILVPTIRAEGSEIWLSFNPELDSDEVYKRFVANPPPNCITVSMNWSDNKFFPSVLDEERRQCQLRAPEDYDTIWEGKCRPTVQGAIYAKEVQQVLENKRIREMQYDSMFPVHTVWDLGWNDDMTISCVQRIGSELRVIKYIEGNMRTYESFIKELKLNDWNWGYDFLPHDARAKNAQTGQSTEDLFRRLGRNPQIISNIGIEEGIKMVRTTLPRMWFDTSCAEMIEHIKRYRRKINQVTNQPEGPLHDEHSHCFVAGTEVTTESGVSRIEDLVPGDFVLTPEGVCLVSAVMWRESGDLVELTFSNGTQIVCTEDHPFITGTGVVRADNISYNDVLYVIRESTCNKSTESKSSTASSSTSSEKDISKPTSSSMEEKRYTCTDMFGSFITEKYLQGLKFITSTVTKPITVSRTLSFLAGKCIKEGIERITTRGTKTSSLQPLKKQERPQRSGTPVKTEELGTRKTENVTGSAEKRLITSASGVAERTGRYGVLSLLPGVIAQTLASQKHGDALELTTRQGNAECAELNSHVTGMHEKLHAVRLVQMRRLEGRREKVYDLTVERSHTFFANGVLVHNCADNLRYIAVAADQMVDGGYSYAAPDVDVPCFDTTIGY